MCSAMVAKKEEEAEDRSYCVAWGKKTRERWWPHSVGRVEAELIVVDPKADNVCFDPNITLGFA